MARPTKYNDPAVARIIRAIRDGATFRLAAATGGIGYSTFREWMLSKPEFAEAVSQAEGDGALASLRRIKQATKEDWRAAAWVLEHRFPNEYGRTVQQQEHSGNVTIGISRYQPKGGVNDDDRPHG